MYKLLVGQADNLSSDNSIKNDSYEDTSIGLEWFLQEVISIFFSLASLRYSIQKLRKKLTSYTYLDEKCIEPWRIRTLLLF